MRSIFIDTLTVTLVCLSSCRFNQSQVEIGEKDGKGGLIFHQWEIGAGKKHAVLKEGYGMMIFFDAANPESTPRYELYVHDESRIIRTRNLERFKEELCGVPRGSLIHFYNTCGPGTHFGLNMSILEELEEFCKSRGLAIEKADGELLVICTCP